jgi:hypothetical protein
MIRGSKSEGTTMITNMSRGIALSIAASAMLAFAFACALPAASASGAVPTSARVSTHSSKPKPPSTKQIESDLSKLASSAGTESKATFDITYEYKNSGSSGTVTLEQMPPDEAFITGTGEILYNGKKTYYCSLSTALKTCISYGSATASPLGATMGIYESGTYVEAMKSWAGLVESRVAGYHASFSNKTIAGQPSTCVTWSYKGNNETYCVTGHGVLASVSGATAKGSTFSFTLTNFSSKVASSTFQLPKDAKVISVP